MTDRSPSRTMISREYLKMIRERTLMNEISCNKIRCLRCGEVIESISIHDFKFCKCGAVAVDGGHDYLRRCGNREDWEELSEMVDDSTK